MKQTEKSGGKPDSAEVNKSRKADKASSSATTMFIMAVLDLTWQMAIVVLVPIIGGFELDKHLGTTPLFTIIGFVLAMVGTFLVIKRVLNSYTKKTLNGAKSK